MLSRFLAPTSPQDHRTPGLPSGPLAHGLVAAWDFTTGSLTDLMRGLTLTRNSDTRFGVRWGAQGLTGVVERAPAVSLVCPDWLKLPHPLTVVMRVGTSTDFIGTGLVFGVSYDHATNADLRGAYGFEAASVIRNIWVNWRSTAGAHGSMSLGEYAQYGRGKMSTVAVRYTATERVGYWNGRLAARTTDTYTGPGYTSDSELWVNGIGDTTVVEYALIYNRALSNAEMAELTGPNPWGWKGYGSNPALWGMDTSEVAPEIGSSFGPLVWVEWDGSDDVVRVWSTVDLPDPSTYYHGYKAPKIIRAGRVVRALSDEQGEYQGQTFEVTVKDIDRDLRTLLGSSDARRHLLNTRGVMRMISQDDWRAKRTPRTVAIGKLRNYRLH